MVTRKYTIYDASEITNIDPSKIASNIRWSIDGSKFLVEWTTTPENEYMNHDEALKLVRSEEWFNPDDYDEINF